MKVISPFSLFSSFKNLSVAIAFVVTAACLLVLLSSSSTNTFINAQAAVVRREWGLFEPLDTANDHYFLMFKESSSTFWRTVTQGSSSISNRDAKYLCGLVGFLGNQVTASIQVSTPPLNYDLGLQLSSCGGFVEDDVVYSFEDQCSFTTSSFSSNQAIKLNCTGPRTGGIYGTPSPAGETYVRLHYTRQFMTRTAFTTRWKPWCDDFIDSGFSTTNGLCTAIDGGKVPRTGSFYSSTTVSQYSTYAGSTLSCPADTKTFDSCTWSSSTSGCAASEAVSLNCEQFESYPISSGGYQFRLASSTQNALILTRRELAGEETTTPYGTICDDSFAAEGFFCSMLGFPSPGATFSSSSTGTTIDTELILKNVQCESSYSSFASCSKTTSFSDCSRSESVYIVCNDPLVLEGTTPVRSGSYELRTVTESPVVNQLQIRSHTNKGLWGLVCDDSFSFTTSSMIFGKFMQNYDHCSWDVVTGISPQTFAFSQVKCWGGEANIDACYKISTRSCFLSESVAVGKCWNYSTGLSLGSWDIRISNDGDNRVEVKNSNSGIAWGGVAYSTTIASSTYARNLCKMLGFGTTGASISRASQKSVKVSMKFLYCFSVQNSLDSCSYTSATTSDLPSTTTFMSLRCGEMATSGSPPSSQNSNPADLAVIIPATVGGIIGGVVLIGVIVAVCVASARSSSASSTNGSSQMAIGSIQNHTNVASWNTAATAPNNQAAAGGGDGLTMSWHRNKTAIPVAGNPTFPNSANSWEMQNTHFQMQHQSSPAFGGAPPPPPPTGFYPHQPMPNTADYAWGMPPPPPPGANGAPWNQQMMFMPPPQGYGQQNFAPGQPFPPPNIASGYPGN